MFKKLALVITGLAVSTALLASTVSHAVGTNLIANPSVETATNAANTAPSNWINGAWGVNTTTLTYKTSEGHTGSKSVYINMTKYTSGAAAWFPATVTVKPSTTYTYSDFYKSNVATQIYAKYTSTTNAITYAKVSVPASTTWKQAVTTFKTPAKTKSMAVYRQIQRVGTLQTDDYTLSEGAGVPVIPAPTAPKVAFSAPAASATISNTQAVSATASDTVGMAGVQFKVDNVAVGAEDTVAPYSVNLNTKTLTNGTHTLTATARNTSNLTTTATEAVTVKNVVVPTAPTVAITAPTSEATVSGKTVAINANASDAVGVSGVQFKLDNVNLGVEDTTAPYSAAWDTTTATNGNHTITAVARNAAALTATSSVTVKVQNTVITPPASPNLIANPSLETANGTVPASWLSSNWGTNTSTFSYLTTGHTGSRSVKVETTAYTDGAANWYYADIPVNAGKTYKYENWYQSNVDTEVDAEVVMNDGTVQYAWLGTVFANTNWNKFSTTFTVPVGAKSIAIYQILAKTGYIISDDYSLSEYTPQPLNRGIVSVTYDDGWTNQYTNALPLMQKYGLTGTYYIISGELADQPDYMSAAQVKNLYTLGNEIGSHSVTHPDLTTVSQANLVNEMSKSKATLEALIGVPVTNFAYPFGAYNANTIAVGKQYYQSQRSVSGGLNTKDNFDITTLKIQEVDSNISQAQVKGWIDSAIAQHAWLILVYHEVAITPTDPTDELYNTQPTDLDAELGYIKSIGITTLNVNQALNEILPQL